MKPVFHPSLVNGAFGDPAVYVDFLFERRALLFDLGDLRKLATRKLLRVWDVFVSHSHMDHFVGFDWLIRLCLGRESRIRLFGPEGFLRQVEGRVGGYTWNLVENYATDFTLEVIEVLSETTARRALFRCRRGFTREAEETLELRQQVLVDEQNRDVRFAILDHKVPCLAFALAEKQHVNIRKNRLDELGLEPGPWLQRFKRALLGGESADTPIHARRRSGQGSVEAVFHLGELAGTIAHVSVGQKVAYVTDAVFHSTNVVRIVELARGADQLFIEAALGDDLRERAGQKFHLTARQAGTLTRWSRVTFPVPFHFSPIRRRQICGQNSNRHWGIRGGDCAIASK